MLAGMKPDAAWSAAGQSPRREGKGLIMVMGADERENLEGLENAAPEDALAGAIRKMIVEIGEDPDREGILKTPGRVSKSLRFLTNGYRQDIDKVLNGALYSVAYDEMVMVRDIEVFSLCEHHLLPFFGRCHVAYVPNGKVIGLSKIPRIVDVFARRLQVQERLTVQIAETIMDKIKPQGVGVIVEARHLCMIMRGVEKQNSIAVTSHMLGVFRDCEGTRSEFLRLLKERT
jgi:GTP cyclohydrolase I